MRTVAKTLFRFLVSFILTLSLCMLVIVITIVNRNDIEKMTMEQLITEKSIRINEVISKLLFKTQTLSALVIQNDGTLIDFERVAMNIIDDPSILNVLIAPDGIVTNVYPLKGNEGVLGLNFFAEGMGNREAILAKETGELVFGGPFELVQGGMALVGRLPIFLDDGTGKEDNFWGLVSVTLKYPEALDSVDLGILSSQGFSYELWRINPDDGQRQVILSSLDKGKINARFIEKHTPILNADWYFRIAPILRWYEYAETWLMIFAGLCISLLVSLTLKNNYELKQMRSGLEDLASRDSQTGIFNRRYFRELATSRLEKAWKSDETGFIVIFDVDFFKNVNDTYGHHIGDIVLQKIADTVNEVISQNELFARYGGEEFMLLLTGCDKQYVIRLTESIRSKIADTPISFECNNIAVTASFGIAPALAEDGLDEAIRRADKAMYDAKADGRNKVKFYNNL